MKILVTGGAGFIGSHLVDALVENGHEVVVIDNLLTGNLKNLDQSIGKITFIEGDITDIKLFDKITKDIDYIFHQAALPSVPRSIKDPILSNRINVEGSLNIFNSAVKNKVKRVVYASSSSVYGNTKELPKKEDVSKNPMSPYALQKSVVEEYAKQFKEIFGLDSVGLRYFNVFGERQDPNSEYSAVIPKFIKLILSNKAPTIYGDGTTTRDFTYVGNVVAANILAMQAENINKSVFNIGVGENFSLNDLVKEINVNLDKNIKPKYTDFREGDVKDSLADISIAKKELKYKPKIDFKEGVGRTIKYIESQQ